MSGTELPASPLCNLIHINLLNIFCVTKRVHCTHPQKKVVILFCNNLHQKSLVQYVASTEWIAQNKNNNKTLQERDINKIHCVTRFNTVCCCYNNVGLLLDLITLEARPWHNNNDCGIIIKIMLHKKRVLEFQQ